MNIDLGKKRIYLASPYSHDNEQIRIQRFEAVALATAFLLANQDVVVYSPIVHSHVIAQHLDNFLDHDFWLTQDASHILSCNELIVYKLAGYDKSFGVSWEIGFANGKSIPVSYLEPEEVYLWHKNHSST